MSDQVQDKAYLDYTGLSAFYGKLKDRYDSSITSLALSDDGKSITITSADGATRSLNTSKFVKDGMLSNVSIWTKTSAEEFVPGYDITGDDGTTTIVTEVGDKFIVFTWNTDAGDTVDYIKTSEIGMTYEAGTGIAITTVGGKDSISVSKVPTAVVNVTTDNTISIDGGPLETALKEAFGSAIPANLTLSDFLLRLAQTEKWPTGVTITWTGQVTTHNKPVASAAGNISTISGYTIGSGSDIYVADTNNMLLNPTKGLTATTTAGKSGFINTVVTPAGASVAKPNTTEPKVVISGFTHGYYKHDAENGTPTSTATSITVPADANSCKINYANCSLKYVVGSTAVATQALGTDGTASLGTDKGSWKLPQGSSTAKYTVSGTAMSGATISGDNKLSVHKYYAASNQGNKDKTFTMSNGTQHTAKLYDLSASSTYSQHGTYANEVFTFKNDSGGAEKTSDNTGTYTGYLPIFTNLIPLSGGDSTNKSSVKTAKYIDLGSSLGDAALTFKADGSNIETNGAYEGNGYLKALPIKYMRTTSGATEIGLGVAFGKADTETERTVKNSSLAANLDYSYINKEHLLVVAVPSDVTVSILIQNAFDQTQWEEDAQSTVTEVGTLKNTINGTTYKCWAVLGYGKNKGDISAKPYIIRFSKSFK